MPKRYENMYSNLNRNNVRRRLNSIYKWSVGRKEATRAGYQGWLDELVDWYGDWAKHQDNRSRPMTDEEADEALEAEKIAWMEDPVEDFDEWAAETFSLTELEVIKTKLDEVIQGKKDKPKTEPKEDAAEGDAAEGDAAEGDAAEGDAAEGDAAEGDAAEGDAAEGDAVDGEQPAE